MKKTVFFGLLAIVLAFGFIGCDTSNDGPEVYEYEGTANGKTYVLIITDGAFELRVGNKVSTGTATKNGNTWTLRPPSGEAFTVTVSSSGITGITGTITFTDGTSQEAPGTITPNPPNNGNGLWENSAIGDRLQVSNAHMYDYDDESGIISPFLYTGNLELRSYGWGLFRDYLEPEDALIVTTITNNSLSFDIGAVLTSKLSPVIDGLSSVPSNVRGVLISSLDYDDWENDEWYYFSLVNRNNVNQMVEFVYVDRDAVITGFDGWQYWELSLKAGWNSVQYDRDRQTFTSFVPDENYIWLNGVADPNDGIGMDPLFIEQYTDKISGTINITVDGSFPAGGIKLEAFSSNESIGIVDIPSGTNPVSWEFADFLPIGGQWNWGYVYFRVTVYPEANRNTFLIYQPSVQSQGNYVGTGINNVLLSNISITTQTVSVSVSGFDVNATMYANDYHSGANYGVEISGNGNYSFKVPNDLGNWLWFWVAPSSGQRYLTKGRLDARLPVVLNAAAMIRQDN